MSETRVKYRWCDKRLEFHWSVVRRDDAHLSDFVCSLYVDGEKVEAAKSALKNVVLADWFAGQFPQRLLSLLKDIDEPSLEGRFWPFDEIPPHRLSGDQLRWLRVCSKDGSQIHTGYSVQVAKQETSFSTGLSIYHYRTRMGKACINALKMKWTPMATMKI
jgi:hypothetical protein